MIYVYYIYIVYIKAVIFGARHSAMLIISTCVSIWSQTRYFVFLYIGGQSPVQNSFNSAHLLRYKEAYASYASPKTQLGFILMIPSSKSLITVHRYPIYILE